MWCVMNCASLFAAGHALFVVGCVSVGARNVRFVVWGWLLGGDSLGVAGCLWFGVVV